MTLRGLRKYGRTEGVTTRECVIGKGERIERRPSLEHVPVADTPILMQQSSQPAYVIMLHLILEASSSPTYLLL